MDLRQFCFNPIQGQFSNCQTINIVRLKSCQISEISILITNFELSKTVQTFYLLNKILMT